jgi:hypothetical protein
MALFPVVDLSVPLETNASISDQVRQQFELLSDALDSANAPLAESLINTMRPLLGNVYMLHALESYMVHADSPSEATTDLFLDQFSVLSVAVKTEEDALYVAPNLSSEVQSLLLFLTEETVTQAVKPGSPNWMMVPISIWTTLLQLGKAASDRHAA